MEDFAGAADGVAAPGSCTSDRLFLDNLLCVVNLYGSLFLVKLLIVSNKVYDLFLGRVPPPSQEKSTTLSIFFIFSFN